MTDEALRELQPRFNKLYAKTGRPSIAPEKLLRALLLQALYSVRSEGMLMEQLNYKGKEAKLSYNGNLLVENRHGLIVNSEVFEANGTADAMPRW